MRRPLDNLSSRVATYWCCSAGAGMVATRRFLTTTPHQARSVAAILLAFGRIGSNPSTTFPPAIALPRAAKGCKGRMNAVRRARAGALGFLLASALCAWSADGAAKGNRAPAGLSRCDDPEVFARIAAEYRGRHWASGFAAVAIRAREIHRKYWPYGDMPRRFCEGTLIAPSRDERPIYYAIIADGPGHEIEWCVVGLDRAWPYDPRCRLARP